MVSRVSWCILLSLIPIGTYFYWVSAASTDVPFGDDFAILHALVHLKKAASPGEWWQTLTATHNEHRIAYLRAMSFLISRCNAGFISLAALLWIGNLSLLGLLLLFWRSYLKQGLPNAYFLPVPFLVFQMQFFENTFWPMAAVQNLSILCFAGTAFYLLTDRNNLAFLFALTLGGLGTYTSGNGLFILPIGIGVLLFQRRWWAAGICLACGSFLTWLYFHNYHAPPSLGNQNSFSERAFAFLGFIGAFIGSSTGRHAPVLMGLGLMGSFIFWAIRILHNRKPLSRNELFYGSFFCWIFLTGIAVVLNRNSHEISSLSRYKLYTMLVLVLTYLAWLPAVVGRRRIVWYGSYLAGSVLFWLFTQYRIPSLFLAHQQQLLADSFNWKHTPAGALDPTHAQVGFSPMALLTEAQAAHVYTIPSVPDVPSDSLWTAVDRSALVPIRFKNQSNYLILDLPTVQPGSFLLLASAHRTYLWPVEMSIDSPQRWLTTGHYFLPGGVIKLSTKSLEPGSYRMALYCMKANPTWAALPIQVHALGLKGLSVLNRHLPPEGKTYRSTIATRPKSDVANPIGNIPSNHRQSATLAQL